ncbi:MAG: hypothetical protein IGS50_09595 [Synechococcales cyanobacterium C42_A2020_086]|jgi:hypothetical protein|nr:hypothetical protein [Synechococcales cyanobacterium C42_A2020_086]
MATHPVGSRIRNQNIQIQVLAGELLRFLLTILVVLMCSGFCGGGLPAQADPVAGSVGEIPATANPFVQLQDLPSGFAPASETEVASCSMAGEVSAFVLKQGEHLSELVCVSSFSIAAASENPAQVEMIRQIYDAILKNPQALVEQAKTMGAEDITILQDLNGIGELATGFSKIEDGIGQTEVMLFRRGNVINSALIRYEVGQTPVLSLQHLARMLDQHVSEVVHESAGNTPG